MTPLNIRVFAAAALLLVSLMCQFVAGSDLQKGPQAQGSSRDATEDRSVILQHTPDPDFPPEIKTDIELAVTLVATFKKNGKVTEVKVISSRVPAFIPADIVTKLEKATVDAAKRIEFSPAIRNGRPTTQRVELLFTFKREKEKQYFDWRPQIAE